MDHGRAIRRCNDLRPRQRDQIENAVALIAARVRVDAPVGGILAVRGLALARNGILRRIPVAARSEERARSSSENPGGTGDLFRCPRRRPPPPLPAIWMARLGAVQIQECKVPRRPAGAKVMSAIALPGVNVEEKRPALIV